LANRHFEDLQTARERGSILSKELSIARKQVEELNRRPFHL
jgi:hypothetical protein